MVSSKSSSSFSLLPNPLLLSHNNISVFSRKCPCSIAQERFRRPTKFSFLQTPLGEQIFHFFFRFKTSTKCSREKKGRKEFKQQRQPNKKSPCIGALQWKNPEKKIDSQRTKKGRTNSNPLHPPHIFQQEISLLRHILSFQGFAWAHVDGKLKPTSTLPEALHIRTVRLVPIV
jgi:hypothetical protein